MITVAVPEQAIADRLGFLGDDARVVVWDPTSGDAPESEREHITIACIPHFTGGRTVYGRLAQCPELKVIQIPSAGYEHAVPFVPAGVSLANAKGVHDARVAEMALALALASRRLLPQFFDAQRRQTWNPEFFTQGLADSRALVIGYGSIGAAIAARLRACDVHVEGVARTARIAPDGTVVHAGSDLPALLPDFDVVVVVTPHSDETDKMVDEGFLAAMPDGALLINVGRGKVVDTEALLAELLSGRLCAALDVTDPEPLPTGHPLWSAPHCIVVPHVAGGAPLTDRHFTDLVRAQVDARRCGDDPVNFVMMGAVPA